MLRIETFFLLLPHLERVHAPAHTHTRVCHNVMSDHKLVNMPFKKIIKAENLFLEQFGSINLLILYDIEAIRIFSTYF